MTTSSFALVRLYEAVISPVMTHTKLFSKTIEVQVGDTNRHAHTISQADPRHYCEPHIIDIRR